MNINNSINMDMPKLDLSNFQDTDTKKIDLLRYLVDATTILSTIDTKAGKEKFIAINFIENYRDCPEFREAYATQYDNISKKFKLYRLKNTFLVGEFYTTKDVKYKLGMIYTNNVTCLEDYKTPKVVDLEDNNWFRFRRIRKLVDGKFVNGVVIIECLIEI